MNTTMGTQGQLEMVTTLCPEALLLVKTSNFPFRRKEPNPTTPRGGWQKSGVFVARIGGRGTFPGPGWEAWIHGRRPTYPSRVTWMRGYCWEQECRRFFFTTCSKTSARSQQKNLHKITLYSKNIIFRPSLIGLVDTGGR